MAARMIGRSAISPPQSGTTNWVVKVISWCQRSSSMPARSAPWRAGDEDVRHQPHGDAQGEEHRDPGVVDVAVEDLRRDPVDERDPHEQESDERGVPGM